MIDSNINVSQHDIVIDSRRAKHVITLFLVLLAGTGIVVLLVEQRPLISGLLGIIRQPDILINDYFERASPGHALINAALCAAIGFTLLFLVRVLVSGPAIAAVFTISGFALFGKNPMNILPVILGVFCFAKINRRPFSEHILVALFGTALAPLVSEIAFGMGLPLPWNFILAVPGGMLAGFVLSPLARHVLDFHRGYNLYNVGFTAGFVGTISLALFKAFGITLSGGFAWSTERPITVLILMCMLIVGLFFAGCMLDRHWYRGYRKLLTSSGRLVSDFVRSFGLGLTLVNMAIMAGLSFGLITLVGAPWNGPILGGVLTITGFAAFGKHPRNALPPMLGAVAMALVSGYDIANPTSLLAMLFAATLAPISGTYGIFAGFMAGILHFVLVQTVGVLHGGINLYNNGFSGGIVAGLMIPILEWLREWRAHEV